MPTESDLLGDLAHPPGPVALRERLAGWAESLDLSLSRLALGATVTIVLGVAAWRLLAPTDAPPEIALPTVAAGNEGAAAAVSDAPGELDGEGVSQPSVPPSANEGEVVVHIAGAVHAPGVHRMTPSARVTDAVEASGGATEQADLARINLAAELQDGQQIYVPAIGEEIAEPLAASGAATGTGSAPTGDGASSAAASGTVDVNSAGVDELESLPGIGPAIGEAIVDHRELNGPFTSLEQLTDVRGIGDAKLEGLRDFATV